MENIFGMKRNLKDPANDSEQKIQPGEIPDYLKKYRTKDSIPAIFRDADSLPSRIAVSDDHTPAAKIVNQSYERQKKIEMKREQQNAIQKVANIAEEKKDPPKEVKVQVELPNLLKTPQKNAEAEAKKSAEK